MACERIPAQNRRNITAGISPFSERTDSKEIVLTIRKARSWAIFCMAVWLTGTVAMAIVATENFYRIDHIIGAQSNPVFVSYIEKLGRDAIHDVMYYYSSELNRFYFQFWNVIQLVVGSSRSGWSSRCQA